MAERYFVSISVGGKCVSLFFSEDLCEIHVCRLLYKGCEIEVFDVVDMRFVPPVKVSTMETLAKRKIKSDILPQHVVCVDTKEIYKSLSDCARNIGIPPSEVADSIQNLARISGHRYVLESDLEWSEII